MTGSGILGFGVPYGLRAIRSRLMLMVAATAAPLFGLLVVETLDARQKALLAAEQEVADYADLTVSRQSQIFRDASSLLATLQTLAVVKADAGPECGEALTRVAAKNPGFMTLGVVRPDNMIPCHSILRTPQHFGDPELLRAALASKPDAFLVGRLIVGRVSGKPTVVTARPLAGANGAVEGMVFASVDLAGFAGLSGRFGESVGKTMMVVEAGRRTVIAGSSGASRFVGQTFADHPLMVAIAAAPQGGSVSMRGLGGHEEIISFAPLQTSPLSTLMTVISVDRTLALAGVERSALFNLASAFAVATLAVLTVWALAYWTLVRPIGRLTEAAQHIGRSDLTARTRMEAYQPAELHTLSATMNLMAERLQTAARQLAAQANEDGLTGLANRRRFDEALAAECKRSERSQRPLSLLLIDVDHFKRFNDLYGHVAGDDCLKRISMELKGCASRPGDLAARYGGEEFAVILADTDQDGASAVAARILSSVEALGVRHRGSSTGIVSVSVGGASTEASPVGGVSPDRLIRMADEALYQAKADGRARYCSRAVEEPPPPVSLGRWRA